MSGRVVAVAVALAAGSLACGGDDPVSADAVLADAEAAMGDLQRGRLELSLRASAGGDDPTGPVGFRVAGDYSYAEGGDLAVLDLEVVDLLGDEERATRVVSDGSSVVVEAGGDAAEVPADALAGLRLGGGEGVADLGIAGWVLEPVLSGDGDARVVTGEVDVADLLADLGRLGAEVSGEVAPAELDDEAAAQLDGLVRSSEIVVEVGSDDVPRSIEASVDFGADVPPALVDALGRYAAARLELSLTLEALDGALVVDLPSG